MPNPPVVLQPGLMVNTPDPTITIAAMKKAGQFVFLLMVTDDAGLTGRAEFLVTVRPG
jgi:hypothetical protein